MQVAAAAGKNPPSLSPFKKTIYVELWWHECSVYPKVDYAIAIVGSLMLAAFSFTAHLGHEPLLQNTNTMRAFAAAAWRGDCTVLSPTKSRYYFRYQIACRVSFYSSTKHRTQALHFNMKLSTTSNMNLIPSFLLIKARKALIF